jgi:hypothetical protein
MTCAVLAHIAGVQMGDAARYAVGLSYLDRSGCS